MKGRASANLGILVLLLLAGIVLGGFIGEYLNKIPMLSWLSYGQEFGLSTPLTLDLGVLCLQLDFTLRFTVAGIIGMVLAVFVYKKL